jgi:dihydropteroate synthase
LFCSNSAWDTGSLAITRKIRYWKLPRTELQLGERTLIMGVLNVTPDSFSDGGRYLDPDRAYARALEMEQQGADIIDIGAESTRPESKRITADEEWQRLVPVLKRLRDKLGIPLSIDTYKAEIATRAFDYGVEIVNDPSGLTLDPNLAKAAALGDAGLILNHMRGTPETWGRLAPLPDVMANVVKELEATASRARRAGVDKARIVLDPGLGFGKRKEQNSELLAHLGRLTQLEYPILVGPSRKAFLQLVAEAEMGYATAAAVAIAIFNGADIVRVHDVLAMRAAVQVADEVVKMDAAAARLAELEAEKANPPKQPRANNWLEPERKTSVRPPLAKSEPVAAAPVVVAAEGTEQAAEEVKSGESTETAEPKVVAEAGETSTPVEGEATAEASVSDETGKPAETAEAKVDEAKTAPVAPPAPAAGKPIWQGGDRPAPKVTYDRPRDGSAPPPRREWTDRPPQRGGYGDRPPQRSGGYGDRPQAGRPGGYGDRPQGRDGGGPPRREWTDRPPRRDFDGPPRRDFGDRPPNRDAGGAPPPRREWTDRPPNREGGAPPPRREWTDRPPRRDFDGPPRRDFGGPPRGNFGDRPPRPYGDRPPNRDGGGAPPPRREWTDRPPRRDFGDKPQGDRPSGGFGGPRKDFGGPPRRDFGGPPRRDFGGPPRGNFGDRPPRRDFGGPPPPRGDWKDRGPRPGGSDRPPNREGGGPPSGGGDSRPPKKLFRKRP